MGARRRMTVAVAIAGVCSSLAACGGARSIDAGNATVLVSERTGGGMDALLEGTLAVISGCLGITSSDQIDTVVVWPHGTEVTHSEPPTIDLPDIGEVVVGDEVSVGGGIVRSGDGFGRWCEHSVRL